jgi:hypothetical protein
MARVLVVLMRVNVSTPDTHITAFMKPFAFEPNERASVGV